MMAGADVATDDLRVHLNLPRYQRLLALESTVAAAREACT
jgi:hypothetical protein